jgi:hypothetical protein
VVLASAASAGESAGVGAGASGVVDMNQVQ